jgi:hypothetical protein
VGGSGVSVAGIGVDVGAKVSVGGISVAVAVGISVDKGVAVNVVGVAVGLGAVETCSVEVSDSDTLSPVVAQLATMRISTARMSIG